MHQAPDRSGVEPNPARSARRLNAAFPLCHELEQLVAVASDGVENCPILRRAAPRT